ncbi:HD domain-containing protein [Aphelenchoides fujianensis]|nr:HD domain-containing protein [Aphelenchoides fujianensis]
MLRNALPIASAGVLSVKNKRWPPTKSEIPKGGYEANDEIHGVIKLPHPLDLVIDTPQFQRLRQIKQLGVTSLVFPCADYHRFEHSVGTAHLAYEWTKAVKDARLGDDVEVSDTDLLCVTLAALIHDLGHGPWSHTFDSQFMPRCHKGKKFDHERISIEMFEYLLKNNPKVKEVLDQYLTEEDYIFIKECIVPPKPLIQDGKWMPKGRGIEKSFLYDIVSNTHEGLDVDKLDYFLRDAQKTNCSIAFNKARDARRHSFLSLRLQFALQRLLANIGVVWSEKAGCHRIGYAKKVEADIITTMNARTDLHTKVYKHKTVLALEYMLVEALSAADLFLHFESSLEPGKQLKLSECYTDMSAYSQLTDDFIFQLISQSQIESLEPARMMLNDLLCRRQPRLLLKWTSQSSDMDKHIEEQIREYMMSAGVIPGRLVFIPATFNQGLRNTDNPVSRVAFFEHHNGKRVEVPCSEQGLSFTTPQRTVVFCFLAGMNDQLRNKVEGPVRKIVGKLVG